MSSPPPPGFPAVLHLSFAGASPPPPPELDLLALAEKARADAEDPVSPLLVKSVATLSVCGILALCMGAIRCWRRRALRRFLAGLPEQSTDGSFVVVAFDWGIGLTSSRLYLNDSIVRQTTARAQIEASAAARGHATRTRGACTPFIFLSHRRARSLTHAKLLHRALTDRRPCPSCSPLPSTAATRSSTRS